MEVPRVRRERLDGRRRAAEPQRRRLARRRGARRARSRCRHGHGEPHLSRGLARLGPGGAHPGDPRDAVTPLDGIKARAGTGSEVRYAKGCGIVDTATAGFAEAVALARQADVALLVLGEAGDMSGEAASRSSLGLPGVQQQLLEAVQATGTPVALILMNGRPLTVQWAADHVPAIVEAWFLGVETGPALADVVFGDVNPSGKLPVTFPRAVGQIPIYYKHKNTGRPAGADKYTSKYTDLPSSPLFPFGFGLSYTSLEYKDLTIDRQCV